MRSSTKLVPALIILLFASCSRDGIAYVDINKLFESFEYKKTLTKEFNKVKSQRQHIVDSLEFELNILASQLERGNTDKIAGEKLFEDGKEKFFAINKQFEEDNQVLLNSYNEKIIKQLNAYIKEYGKENGYALIMGADNKGSLLYGKESLDITEAMSEYINNRYKGEKISK